MVAAARQLRREFELIRMEKEFAVEEILTKVPILRQEFVRLRRYNPHRARQLAGEVPGEHPRGAGSLAAALAMVFRIAGPRPFRQRSGPLRAPQPDP
ncbi:hypothetical protein [Streptomyces blattellae]|uniref:hypothetical protein n=1 Tax=Streptomyces blattellae TaxID=2569855 RepID=UPI0012B72DD4|nr:hypothetical protein [Streptomyces blattellae]